MPQLRLIVALVAGTAALACTASTPGRPGPRGGQGGAVATGGSGGSGGSGGQSAGGSGGTSSGGTGGTSSGGTGGTSTGDSGGTSSGGTGGAPRDGAAPGADAAPASDGPSTAARPSAGCGKMSPTNGRRTIMTGGKTGNYIVALPPGYDPNKPYPLGFAFHGYNLDEKTCHDGPECPGFRTVVGAKAITVFPKSIGPGWEFPLNLLAPNVQFVRDIIAVMKAEYCVDESRVFVAGVSSGGQMVHHLSCQLGEELWAGAPIAGYLETGSRTNCKGAPAEVVIHGTTDNLKNGQAGRDFIAMKNGCPMPPADLKDMEAKIAAAYTARRTEYSCVTYAGCAKNPLRYCVHSQVIYNGLTHGWPDAAGQIIADFLATLNQ